MPPTPIAQRRVVRQVSLPRRLAAPWMGEFLSALMVHPRRGAWHTSCSVRQTLYMVQKFLMVEGLTAFPTLCDFESHMRNLGAERARWRAEEEEKTKKNGSFPSPRRYTERFSVHCKSASAARRYAVVYNLLFVDVFGVVRDRFQKKHLRPGFWFVGWLCIHSWILFSFVSSFTLARR